MNRLACAAAALLPLAANAGPYKDRVLDTLDALDDGRAALRKAGSDCRQALDSNFATATRDVEDLRGGGSQPRIQSVQLFIAGMALAGGVAGCPDRVMSALNDAQDSLTRAKNIAADRDDDRDDRRSRRRGDRDRDDDDRYDRRDRRDRYDDDRDDDDRPRSKRPVRVEPMGERDFNALLAAVAAESFGQQKLGVVQTASSGWFTVDQVGRLVDQMSFGNDKVKVVELLNSRIVDKQNGFQLYSHFTFSNDKEQVKKLLAR
jgi:hypothetical protein